MYSRMKAYSYQSLMWLLVWMTFVYQFTFAFVLPYAEEVEAPVLYGAMDFVPWIPQIWGLLGIACIVMMFVAIYTRNKTLTRVFSVGQMMLWAFAFTVYVQSGLYILAAGISLTACLFWAWNMGGREDENKRLYKRIMDALDYEI